MKIEETGIEGLKVVQLEVYGDDRGFFVERFNHDKFAAAGLPTDFKQDNHSRSTPGVIRGLHYQYEPTQGKLVGAARGRLFDVAVDIRVDSPTFGKHFGIELSDTNGKLLWVPGGFAHGFCALPDENIDANGGVSYVDMLYKCTNVYNPKNEGGIMYNDPDIGIKWPVADAVISDRDKQQQSLAQYKENPPVWID